MAARAPAPNPVPRNLLEHVLDRRSALRPSEQLVADFVLRAPEAVTTTSMAELAAATGVSEPTVLRFCHQLGCSGFPELKLKLAHDAECRVLARDIHDAAPIRIEGRVR